LTAARVLDLELNLDIAAVSLPEPHLRRRAGAAHARDTNFVAIAAAAGRHLRRRDPAEQRRDRGNDHQAWRHDEASRHDP
jgi:hypothetical protein